MIISLLFGLLIGSFLNVVISRLPKGESIVTPRSHCPDCGQMIVWYDNIPVLSFFILKGKCRSCGKPISLRYPVVELLTGLLSYLTYWKFGFGISYFCYFLLLVAPLIAITFIDLKHQIIPNQISLPGIAAGAITSLALFGINQETFSWIFLGILAGAGTLFLVGWSYEKIKKREGLGMGDVKLAAMLGAFFGWKAVFLILLLSSLLGSLIGGLLLLMTRKGLKEPIPFGPFLAGAGLTHLFWGNELIRWYLHWTTLN